MNIFVLSTSYYENLIIRLINSLSFNSDNIATAYVLRENHDADEFVFNDIVLPVVLVETVSEAIKHCDIIILLNTGGISKELESQLNFYSKNNSKTIINLNVPEISQCHDVPTNETLSNYPTILLVAIGAFTQISVCEVLLSRLLHENGVPMRNFWSKLTCYIYDKLMSETNIFKDISKEDNIGAVVLKTIELKSIAELLYNKDIVKQINEIRPDYLIVISEEYCEGFEEIENVFKYKYNFEVNQKLKSDYFAVLWDNDIVSVKAPISSSILQLVCDKGYEEKLINDILINISFPEGILPIVSK